MSNISKIFDDDAYQALKGSVLELHQAMREADTSANWQQVGRLAGLRERARTDQECSAHEKIVNQLNSLHESYKNDPVALFVILQACSRSVGIYRDNGACVLLDTVNSMYAGFVVRGQRSKNPMTKLAVGCNYWGHQQHRQLARSILWRVKTPGTRCEDEAKASLKRMGLS